jgi:integrase
MGEWVANAEDRRSVRDRTIEADLKWLNAVFNWAVRWQDGQGRYLLSENPVRGYPIPKEKNPLRPVMTQDRYLALRDVSDQVTMEIMVGGSLEKVRSYLTELLDLANETGRRLSAILGLRYQDLRLERPPTAPYGAISWPADTDKQARAWEAVPISVIARAAIDRILKERPAIGEAPLFPAPADPSKPVDRYLADKWLREAEMLAGLDPQKGSLWHAFRRKAATELKGAPDKDVMALLGWTDYRSLKSAYQHADPETMLLAIETRRELRQARQ